MTIEEIQKLVDEKRAWSGEHQFFISDKDGKVHSGYTIFMSLKTAFELDDKQFNDRRH